MNYFLGVDGGGTKSVCVVTDYQFNIIHKEEGGPTNFLAFHPDEAAENLFNLICECKKKLVIEDRDIASVCIATAGVGREEDANFLKEKLTELNKKKKCAISNFYITGDMEAALEGAFSGGPGIMLIAGTGSICCGKNREGNLIRVGGNGRVIGDEGSGFSIGRKGLRTALRSYDGRCLETKMLSEIFGIMKVNSPDEVIKKVYRENYNIAQLAETVIACAVNNDEAAWNIVNEEAEELVLHLYAILPKLNVSEAKLAFGGSLLTNENLYKDLVVKRINKAFPNIEIVEPEKSPEIGAAMIAKRKFS